MLNRNEMQFYDEITKQTQRERGGSLRRMPHVVPIRP